MRALGMVKSGMSRQKIAQALNIKRQLVSQWSRDPERIELLAKHNRKRYPGGGRRSSKAPPVIPTPLNMDILCSDDPSGEIES